MSTRLDSHISENYDERKYRTEVYNIVHELRKLKLISNSAFLLYDLYKKIAGENGACWVGTRNLAKELGMGLATIVRAKKELTKKFALLGGKSLIEVRKGDPKKEETDSVTIVYIGAENYRFFSEKYKESKKIPTCSATETGVFHHRNDPVPLQKRNKEPLKKEPYKKAAAKEKTSKPKAPFTFTAAPAAADFEKIIKRVGEVSLNLKEPFLLKCVNQIIDSKGLDELEAVKYLRSVISKLHRSNQHNKIASHNGWLIKAIKDDYTQE